MKSRRIPKHLTDRARALRSNATPQERILWRLLPRFRPKFTRQLSIDPYTADLACREAKLIVELTAASTSTRSTTNTALNSFRRMDGP